MAFMSDGLQISRKIGRFFFRVEPQTVAFNVQWVVNVVGEKHTGAQSLRHFRLESGTPLCDGIEADVGF